MVFKRSRFLIQHISYPALFSHLDPLFKTSKSIAVEGQTGMKGSSQLQLGSHRYSIKVGCTDEQSEKAEAQKEWAKTRSKS